jgi:MFS family permease
MPPDNSQTVSWRLLPVTIAVFVGFLAIGLPLAVLPLHVHATLGMSAFVVGIVVGSQSVAAVLSRLWGGRLADTKGAKRTFIAGCAAAAVSGFCYLGSLAFLANPDFSVGILVLGRLLLGVAQSLIITGALSWGVGLLGPQNAGAVMAWVGMAMYAAYAIGAPAGVTIYAHQSFFGVALATGLIPMLALGMVIRLRPVAPAAQRPVPFYEILAAVWLPGLGLAFSSAGFGTITVAVALLFAEQSWGDASLAFTAFGACLVGARLLFGHLPDKIGGTRVALVCVLIEVAGQALIWRAGTPEVADIGIALTGFGYSLVYPGFGVEAVRRAPQQGRGSAMGAYAAFLDVALGVVGPAAGFIASYYSLRAVFLFGAATAAGALAVALSLLASPQRP